MSAPEGPSVTQTQIMPFKEPSDGVLLEGPPPDGASVNNMPRSGLAFAEDGVSWLPQQPSVGTAQTPSLPKPLIPSLPLNADGTVKGGKEKLVSALLEKNDGMLWADSHGDTDVVDALSDLLPTLKTSGVQSLYIEMVASADQQVLDKFQKDGDTEALKKHLVKTGWDHAGDGKEADHLVKMLANARKTGIKIYGIDESGSGRLPLSERKERANPHWVQVIRENLSTHPGLGKYVVFGGAAHSGNYPAYSRNYPGYKGVNALLGIPSITPYTTGNENYDKSRYEDNPSRLSINEINIMKMPEGAVAPNPNQNASDFIYRSH
jgi:hypothetical protein